MVAAHMKFVVSLRLPVTGERLTETENYVAWDLETLRLSWEVPGRWTNPAGFGLSVAVTQDRMGSVQTWVEGEAAKLIEYLNRFDTVVGFNSRRFDNKVLGAYGDVTVLDMHTVDLLEDISAACGRPNCVSLDRLAECLFGETKLLDDPTDAVRMWRTGRPEDREYVVRYCQQDVDLTFRAYEFGRRNGFVIVPAPDTFWNELPLVARVPVEWGDEIVRPLVQPEALDL